MTSEQQKHKPKQSKIRYTEYYDLQSIFDSLYADSLNGKTFQNLMRLIASGENIKLAYRTIKGNKGSGTPGVDKRTIKDLAALREEQYVRLIQKQFSWYTPHPVKRVEIPKPNGKTRPLGIPTIVDRIVQQCILQVLEPICEAKFHERSNGFRPNRSTEHAIAQCCRLMQIQHLHYAVDIDIQGFFDNVNHGKLIRQMWEMGIRDKKLLCIVKQMLKAQVVLPDGTRTTPTKGTPQGGILSPLLSNIVLNELDWWVTSQWEEMPTHYEYKTRQNAHGTDIKSHTYRVLRRSKLKEMYIVRYADDFKIFCRRRQDAEKAFEDNRISLYAAQYGRCTITGVNLMSYDIRCHHKVPLENGSTDEYGNLVLVTEAVHILIHATLGETIQKYLKELQLNKKQPKTRDRPPAPHYSEPLFTA